MRRGETAGTIILSGIGALMSVWLALLAAPYVAGGLPELLREMPDAVNHPFAIRLCGDSARTVLFFLLAYGMGTGIYFSTRKNYRRGEEHGSAKWGSARKISRKYRDRKNPEVNKLLTAHVSVGYNSRKHRRNLLTVVVGGSGDCGIIVTGRTNPVKSRVCEA